MLIHIANVLDGAALAHHTPTLATLAWEDGRATAGWAAELVKANEQAGAGDNAALALKCSMSEAILGNDVFQLAVRPKALSPLLISRYLPGMSYGSHVDDALMGGMRSDVSFTLFLSDPASYDGGELVIESAAGEEDVKLAAGSLVTYPSGALHHVAPVTRGVRYGAVGWARSFIRDASLRELLFDLETARRSLFARDGKSREFDLMSKCSANLFRAWADD